MINVPDGVMPAHTEWKANCGPAAFAAVTGKNMAEVRRLFGHFPQKPWTSLQHMESALTASGRLVTSHGVSMPPRGLVHVQWTFRTRRPGMRFSHWIAVEKFPNTWVVYDVNHPMLIGFRAWEESICRELYTQHGGIGYRVNKTYAVPE
jgi:hypothetical protein